MPYKVNLNYQDEFQSNQSVNPNYVGKNLTQVVDGKGGIVIVASKGSVYTHPKFPACRKFKSLRGCGY